MVLSRSYRHVACPVLARDPLRLTCFDRVAALCAIKVNYLGHFLLTLLLKDLLHPGSRVVNVASVGHKFGVVDLTNMNGERSYKNFPFYGNSKLYQAGLEYVRSPFTAITNGSNLCGA